jgi:hypothetical protein
MIQYNDSVFPKLQLTKWRGVDLPLYNKWVTTPREMRMGEEEWRMRLRGDAHE